MIDTLTIITQVTSSITFVLLGIAMGITFIVISRRTLGEQLSKSILLFCCFLLLFMFAVGFMSLYHWLSSDGMEDAWYIALVISLTFGIASSAYVLSLLRSTGDTTVR